MFENIELLKNNSIIRVNNFTIQFKKYFPKYSILYTKKLIFIKEKYNN